MAPKHNIDSSISPTTASASTETAPDITSVHHSGVPSPYYATERPHSEQPGPLAEAQLKTPSDTSALTETPSDVEVGEILAVGEDTNRRFIGVPARAAVASETTLLDTTPQVAATAPAIEARKKTNPWDVREWSVTKKVVAGIGVVVVAVVAAKAVTSSPTAKQQAPESSPYLYGDGSIKTTAPTEITSATTSISIVGNTPPTTSIPATTEAPSATSTVDSFVLQPAANPNALPADIQKYIVNEQQASQDPAEYWTAYAKSLGMKPGVVPVADREQLARSLKVNDPTGTGTVLNDAQAENLTAYATAVSLNRELSPSNIFKLKQNLAKYFVWNAGDDSSYTNGIYNGGSFLSAFNNEINKFPPGILMNVSVNAIGLNADATKKYTLLTIEAAADSGATVAKVDVTVPYTQMNVLPQMDSTTPVSDQTFTIR